MVAASDRGVVRWRIVGTYTHDRSGVVPMGRSLELEGIAMCHVADGCLRGRWVVYGGLNSARRLQAGA